MLGVERSGRVRWAVSSTDMKDELFFSLLSEHALCPALPQPSGLRDDVLGFGLRVQGAGLRGPTSPCEVRCSLLDPWLAASTAGLVQNDLLVIQQAFHIHAPRPPKNLPYFISKDHSPCQACSVSPGFSFFSFVFKSLPSFLQHTSNFLLAKRS